MTVLTTSTADAGTAINAWDEARLSLPLARTPQVSWHRSSALFCCRRFHRVAFPEPLHVVGLIIDPETGQFRVDSDRMVARGRDISVGGISFRHNEPLPHQFVAVSFRSPFGTKTLVAKLSWCRFAREGYYMSGGRLIDHPRGDIEFDIDWDLFPAA